MKIALFGASGTIGSRIAQEARDRGHTVTPLGSKDADAKDADAVATVVRGHDAIVNAVGPNHGDEPADMLAQVARALIEGAHKAGVKRLAVVGGAGSLEVAPGLKLVDAPTFPAALRDLALAHEQALQIYRSAAGLDWSYLSPAALIEPGARTGKYRTGGEQLLTDAQGNSKISAEDYAVALIDELERSQHVKERFAVAY